VHVRITALKITAEQHGTAAGITRGVDVRVADQADSITEQSYGSAGLSGGLAGDVDRAGNEQRS